MKLYIFNEFSGSGSEKENTDALILRAVQTYLKQGGGDPSTVPTILRTAEGKPYFEDLPIHFSISHTGTLWLCIMGNSPVGIDIQRIKPLGMDRVAKRFFTPEEQDYISQTGEAGFFSVWCRKEAYTKYFGSTLATEISKVNMVSEGQLLTEINGIYLTDCPITEDTHCTVAKGTKEEIWINILD